MSLSEQLFGKSSLQDKQHQQQSKNIRPKQTTMMMQIEKGIWLMRLMSMKRKTDERSLLRIFRTVYPKRKSVNSLRPAVKLNRCAYDRKFSDQWATKTSKEAAPS